jgi:hypothetical protein
MLVELDAQDCEFVLTLLEREWFDAQMERDRADFHESHVDLGREHRLEHLAESLQTPVVRDGNDQLRTVSCA